MYQINKNEIDKLKKELQKERERESKTMKRILLKNHSVFRIDFIYQVWYQFQFIYIDL